MEPCHSCQLPHAEPTESSAGPCVQAQAAAMKKLLALIGSPGVCRGCGARIYWARHNNGANVPYTEAGLNHFVNCSEREQFRKDRKVASR